VIDRKKEEAGAEAQPSDGQCAPFSGRLSEKTLRKAQPVLSKPDGSGNTFCDAGTSTIHNDRGAKRLERTAGLHLPICTEFDFRKNIKVAYYIYNYWLPIIGYLQSCI